MGIFAKATGIALRIAALLLIVLAVLVGLVRLTLPLVPDYRTQVRDFAIEATGLAIDFEQVSATWPLSGPELRFSEASIALPGEPDTLLLEADEVRLGLDLVTLFTQRRFAAGRVLVAGTTVVLERTPEVIIVNGVELDWPLPAGETPPVDRLRVELRDVDVTLRDATRRLPVIDFVVTRAGAQVRRERLLMHADLDFDELLARRVEWSAELPLAATDPGEAEWSMALRGADIELAGWLALVLDSEPAITAGRGALEFEARMRGWEPVYIDAHADFRDVQANETSPGWRQLAGNVGWKRDGDGWALDIERLRVVAADGRAWPDTAIRASRSVRPDGRDRLAVRLDYIGLEDVVALVGIVPPALWPDDFLWPEQGSGELQVIEFDAEWGAGEPPSLRYGGRIVGAGIRMPGEDGLALDGVTARVDGREDGGRLVLDAGPGTLQLPAVFAQPREFERAAAELTWLISDDGIRVQTDDVSIAVPDAQGDARAVLWIPREGEPEVDLEATVRAAEARAILPWLPYRNLSPALLDWLDRGIGDGSRLDAAEVTWRGPLQGFPYDAPRFDDRDARFRLVLDVSDAALEYAPGWPRIDDLDARVEIDGVTLDVPENRGQIGGIAFADASIRFANLREPELALLTAESMTAGQLVDFLRASPLADVLGPQLAAVEVDDGSVEAEIDLRLPLRRAREFELDGRFALADTTVGLDYLPVRLGNANGVVTLRNTRLSAQGLRAEFLGEPVEIDLLPMPLDDPRWSHAALARGSTPVDALLELFPLPLSTRFGGDLDWSLRVRLPAGDAPDPPPLTVLLATPLRGFESSLPAPLGKPVDEVDRLQLALEFPRRVIEAAEEPTRIDVYGRLQRGVYWTLRLTDEDGWGLERGTVHAGTRLAELPGTEGLDLTGSIGTLDLGGWLGLEQFEGLRATPLHGLDLAVDELQVLGRRFANVAAVGRRQAEDWRIELRGPEVDGEIRIPVRMDNEDPLIVDMNRFRLPADETAADVGQDAGQDVGEGAGDRLDPRSLPPASIRVDDFGVGAASLGELRAELRREEQGVRLAELRTRGESFGIDATGHWSRDPETPARSRSQVEFALDSSDVAATLRELGNEPFIEGRRARLTAELRWPGAPSAELADVSAGDIRVRIERGQLLQVEPGGGRVLGLLSVAALPKRLALDFRDVVDRGLAFDEISGDFRIEGGTAWTCNLGLEGSVADMAIVGRAGLKNRDYDQLAVVRPHVSDALVVGGAVIGGPAVGASMLLLSQLFRRPLSTIGETYYQIRGEWERPEVSRIQRADVDTAAFRDCERWLEETLPDPIVPLLLPFELPEPDEENEE